MTDKKSSNDRTNRLRSIANKAKLKGIDALVTGDNVTALHYAGRLDKLGFASDAKYIRDYTRGVFVDPYDAFFGPLLW